MATPISGGTAFDFGAAAQATAAQPQTTTTSVKQPTKIEPTGDTVRISPGAQVRLLRTQGQTVTEIAINTALSAEVVNNYLGIAPPLAPTVTASNK
jgi:predicted nucleic acid-binding Zn ribbon protein